MIIVATNKDDFENSYEMIISKYSYEQLVYEFAIKEEQYKQIQIERKLLLEEAKRRLRQQGENLRENIKIRSLKANEIEIRVAQVVEKGAQLLLYKDSRCDKRILDETFGISGWRNFYQEIKGNLFCTIEIWDKENEQWIAKTDCGVESFSEKEKGEASDAFKRAGFNVGIGRELYTKIFIFVPCELSLIHI